VIRHIVEPTEIILDRFHGEQIQPRVRTFGDRAKSVETQLHVGTFIVVEQPARTKHDFLTPHPQTHTVRTAGVGTNLKECLMNIAAVFVDIGPRATVPPVLEVKLEFGKQRI
jgi:hypothetical protein